MYIFLECWVYVDEHICASVIHRCVPSHGGQQSANFVVLVDLATFWGHGVSLSWSLQRWLNKEINKIYRPSFTHNPKVVT